MATQGSRKGQWTLLQLFYLHTVIAVVLTVWGKTVMGAVEFLKRGDLASLELMGHWFVTPFCYLAPLLGEEPMLPPWPGWNELGEHCLWSFGAGVTLAVVLFGLLVFDAYHVWQRWQAR